MERIKNFFSDESGASAVEYGLLVAVLAVMSPQFAQRNWVFRLLVSMNGKMKKVRLLQVELAPTLVVFLPKHFCNPRNITNMPALVLLSMVSKFRV